MSLPHAVMCLIIGPTVLFATAPTLNIFQWFEEDGFIHAPTNLAIQLALLFSVVYYIWDTYCIFTICGKVSNGKLRFDDYGYLFHHFTCGVGMLCPALFGVDGPLVLYAFLQGEFSNPPRGIAEALEFEMESMKTAVVTQKINDVELAKHNLTRKDMQERYEQIFNKYLICLDWHFYLFLIFRAVLTYFAMFFVLPHGQLPTTFGCAFLMIIFSIGSFFILIPGRMKRAQNMDKLKQLYDDLPEDAGDKKKKLN